MTSVYRGGSRILGKGESDKYIHNWGGYGRGRAPPVTARGSGGALIAPPVGSPAFLLLHLFTDKRLMYVLL